MRVSAFAEDFNIEDSIIKSKEISKYLKEKAELFSFSFLDAANFLKVSEIDGIHLDYEGNKLLADLLYEWVRENL
jgi:lysophospholipase L1-like esterase